MSEPLSKRRLKLWIRLLRTTRGLEAELREWIRVAHDSTLPRFDVLAALHRANGPLTMSELSRQLLVSNGNVTTIVDRLVSDGWVNRTPLPTDRRTMHVTLTELGRARFEAQAEEHETKVDRLLAGVTHADLDALEALLPKLSARKAER